MTESIKVVATLFDDACDAFDHEQKAEAPSMEGVMVAASLPSVKRSHPTHFPGVVQRHKSAAVSAPVLQLSFPSVEFDYSLRLPEKINEEKSFVPRRLAKFVLSISALNNYLRCPLEFYHKNLLRIPTAKSDAMEFGSAFHFAVQRLFEKMRLNPGKQFPGFDEMKDDFTWYMRHVGANMSEDNLNRRVTYGEQVIETYHKKYIYSWKKIVAIERNIRAVVKGVPIKGKIDKLEFDGRHANIVEYKTGDFEKAKLRLRPPSEQQPNGGDYWRQAVFYIMLVNNYSGKNWKALSAEFDFVEPDKNKIYHKISLEIRLQDIETVSQQISGAWRNIQALNFYTGCGKANCVWCNMAG